MTVAANIAARRKALKYKQLYVATILNISQNAYSKIETGQSRITVERLFEIADALEVDPAELLVIKP